MPLIILIVVLVLHLVFGILNRGALTTTQDINFGFGLYTGPLGLNLLITSALISLLAYLLYSFSALRRDAGTAKLLRDLDSVRQSLDTQEASRFAQLQASLDKRFAGLDTQLTQGRALPAGGVSLSKDASAEISQELAALQAYLRRKLGD